MFFHTSCLYTSLLSCVTELASETSSVTSKEDQPEEQDIQIDVIQAEAATKIQSAFRGFKVRQIFKMGRNFLVLIVANALSEDLLFTD